MTTQSLKKTAVVFILSFSIVSGFAYHNQTTGSLQAQVLETKLELKTKEEQYKKEINNLKNLLLINDNYSTKPNDPTIYDFFHHTVESQEYVCPPTVEFVMTDYY